MTDALTTLAAGRPLDEATWQSFWDDLLADRLAAAGGDITSPPLGAHPEIIDLIVRRYRENSAAIGR